ncbi:MAG: class I SAM-dependent methyltransferase [Burkholderiaceae bacterium]
MSDEPRPTSNPLATQPSPWVERFARGVPAGSRVLDLACGHGRHARLFASCGCQVTAVDSNPACGASLAGLDAIEFMQADLEAAPWPFEGKRFDAIVVVHYLHRPLFPFISAALEPRGLLIYETFAVGNEHFGRPRNPDFLLRPRELLDVFSRLRIIAFEDGYVAKPFPAVVQRLAARQLEPDASNPIEALIL